MGNVFCGITTKSGRPDHREFEHCVCCQRPASRFRVVVEGKFDISTNGCRIAIVRHPDATVEMSVLTSVFVGGARLIGVGIPTVCFYKCSLMLQTLVLQASSEVQYVFVVTLWCVSPNQGVLARLFLMFPPIVPQMSCAHGDAWSFARQTLELHVVSLDRFRCGEE